MMANPIGSVAVEVDATLKVDELTARACAALLSLYAKQSNMQPIVTKDSDGDFVVALVGAVE